MGQIVKRKKKGRPSKADLARRAATTGLPASSPRERNVRRSLRHRNVSCMFDFDDFIDDDGELEDDRMENELKQLLKNTRSESEPSRTRRVEHATLSSDEEEDGRSLSKRRKINVDFEVNRGVEEEDNHESDDINQDKNGIDGEEEMDFEDQLEAEDVRLVIQWASDRERNGGRASVQLSRTHSLT